MSGRRYLPTLATLVWCLPSSGWTGPVTGHRRPAKGGCLESQLREPFSRSSFLPVVNGITPLHPQRPPPGNHKKKHQSQCRSACQSVVSPVAWRSSPDLRVFQRRRARLRSLESSASSSSARTRPNPPAPTTQPRSSSGPFSPSLVLEPPATLPW